MIKTQNKKTKASKNGDSGCDDGLHLTETKFWSTLMEDIFGTRKGGAIIFVDAENARKGVAKTTCAVAMAKVLSRYFRYDLKEDDLTLSAMEYLRRYGEHPGKEQPSVLVIDEMVGAGAGDKRRAMTNQNLDIGRAWQLLRSKRVVTLTTLPDWNEVDTRLKKLADYRLWCLERRIGSFYPYKVTVPFDTDGHGMTVGTKGLSYDESSARLIEFPNLHRHEDPHYMSLTEKKQELVDSQTWDADEVVGEDEEEEPTDPDEIKRRQAIKYAIQLYKPWEGDDRSELPTQEEVAEAIGEYSRSWVRNRIREWRNDEHRDLVSAPAKVKA